LRFWHATCEWKCRRNPINQQEWEFVMSKRSMLVASSLVVLAAGCAAPSSGCSYATAGTPARVGYTADYHFLTAR
jgi:hypothetical protein